MLARPRARPRARLHADRPGRRRDAARPRRGHRRAQRRRGRHRRRRVRAVPARRHGRRTACSPRIDVEGENQRAAKEAFAEAGIAPTRYRLINGSAAEVLPRMRDAAYDLVFVDADKAAYAVYYEQARAAAAPRRRRGVRQRAVARPGRRPVAARPRHRRRCASSAKTVRDDERLVPALLPVGRRAAGRRQALTGWRPHDLLRRHRPSLPRRRAALHRVLPPARRHPRRAARDGRRSSASRARFFQDHPWRWHHDLPAPPARRGPSSSARGR